MSGGVEHGLFVLEYRLFTLDVLLFPFFSIILSNEAIGVDRRDLP